jgi:hypothetical protein
VSVKGKYLSVAARDGGVPLDDPREEITLNAHTERKRSDIEEDQRVDLTAEHTTLNSSTHSCDHDGEEEEEEQ